MPEIHQPTSGITAHESEDAALEEARRDSREELQCALGQLKLMAEAVAELKQLGEGHDERRNQLEHERDRRRENAGDHLKFAVRVLFNALAVRGWRAVRPDARRFSQTLPEICQEIQKTVDCTELEALIADALSERTKGWAARSLFEGSIRNSSVWREHGAGFQMLAKQERNAFKKAKDLDLLHALGSYPQGNLGYGDWHMTGSNPNFRATFEARATSAGISLAAPKHVSPLTFWLNRLFRELLEARNPYLRYADNKVGGMILLLFEASATICAQLERIALENEISMNANVVPATPEKPAMEAHESKTLAATPLATVETSSPTDRTEESDKSAHRRAMVEQFQHRCKKTTSISIPVTKKHIWRAAGHTTPRQFQYWLRGEDRIPRSRSTRGATAEDERNFQRILTMEPGEFLSLLQEKGIIPRTKA